MTTTHAILAHSIVTFGVTIGVTLATVAGATAATPDRARPEAAAPQVLTNTAHVEAIAVAGERAWVATRGGVEVYSLTERRRQHLYTTADGLAEIHVERIAVSRGPAGADEVSVRTRDYRCQLRGATFACVPAPTLPVATPQRAASHAGARVTARATAGAGQLIGTAGAGLWLEPSEPSAEPVRLTPDDQLCSNHIMAMTEYRGQLYLAGFDGGVCVTDGTTFRRLDTPFRMVNSIVATPRGVYAAANAGLFHAADGETFRKVAFVTERGVNGLAFDGRTLWATSPATLWRIRVQGGPRNRSYWLPGGARAVQRVAVARGAVWMASEDRGIIRFARGKFQVLALATGLPTSWVMDVTAGPGDTVYAATFRHGLLALDVGEDGSAAALDRLSVRAIPETPDPWQLHVSRHGDDIWVGTQRGAARIASDGTTTTVRDGLPHPCVHAITSFAGQVWLGTEGGVYIVPQPASGP